MKELYWSIDDWMTLNPDGWSSKPKVAALVGAILALRPAVVCEIGIWNGKSFIPMAMAMKHIQSKGVLIGIDPWSAGASVQGLEGEHAIWWANAPYEKIYKMFNDEMTRMNLHPYCQVYRCRSDEWKIPDGMQFDLVHADGNHGEEASTYDVTHYASRIRIGGFLYFDDLQWASKASSMIPEMGFIKLFDEDGGAMYQRVGKPTL